MLRMFCGYDNDISTGRLNKVMLVGPGSIIRGICDCIMNTDIAYSYRFTPEVLSKVDVARKLSNDSFNTEYFGITISFNVAEKCYCGRPYILLNKSIQLIDSNQILDLLMYQTQNRMTQNLLQNSILESIKLNMELSDFIESATNVLFESIEKASTDGYDTYDSLCKLNAEFTQNMTDIIANVRFQ